MPDRPEIEVPPCRRWECYENQIWLKFWQVIVMLLGIALTIAIVTIASGCGFSVPLSERVRCDIQIDAQFVTTEPLPDERTRE
jgi:hypothetical protein